MSHYVILTFLLFFIQEVEKLLDVDFGFVTNQLLSDISDSNLKTLVGDRLLEELDKVSVVPIQAVKKLSDGEHMALNNDSILNTWQTGLQ